MRKTVLGLVTVVVALAAAACGGTTAPQGSKRAQVGDLRGASASRVLSAATAAATKAGSAHYVLVAKLGGQTQTITGDAGTDEAEQTVTQGSQRVQVTYVGGVAYVEGNSGGLVSAMGLSSSVADKYAGKWIAVHSTDSLHKAIVQAVTLGPTLAELLPTAPLVFGPPTTAAGRQALVVKGGLPTGTTSGVSGSTTLTVAATAPMLPLRFSGKASTGAADSCTFSRWGEPIDLTAPTTSVPFSSLPKSSSS